MHEYTIRMDRTDVSSQAPEVWEHVKGTSKADALRNLIETITAKTERSRQRRKPGPNPKYPMPSDER